MDENQTPTTGADDDDVQALLRDLAALVPEEPPEPRGALADLLAGKRVLPRQRRSRRTVAGGTALAIGVVLGSGVAAAASNHLPDAAQRAAHEFAESFLPFAIPAPPTGRHQVVSEPDAAHPSTLPSPSPEPTAGGTDRHDSGDSVGQEPSGTSGRHASGDSRSSEGSGDSGSDDRSRSNASDGDDDSGTSGGSDSSDSSGSSGSDDGGTGTTTSGGSGTDSTSDGGDSDSGSSGSGDSTDASDSSDSGSGSGSAGDSGSGDDGGSGSVDAD